MSYMRRVSLTSGLSLQAHAEVVSCDAEVNRPPATGSLWDIVSPSALSDTLRKLKWLRRAARGKALAQRLQKAPCQFDPQGGMHIIAAANRVNGLSRAYRYEIARLASTAGKPLSCSPEAASTFLILGQPKDYRKLLANPPKGFSDGYRIGLWVTEFEAARPDWEFAFEIVHEIWTPSSFSAKAILSGTTLPVKVVPHAVSVPDVAPMPRAQFGIGGDQFLAMAIMDLSSCPDRKNPLANIRAWKQAFGNDPDAHLLVKVKFSRHTRFARRELAEEIGGARNISVIEAALSDHEMAAFQRMADVYLSLHRAEGYGLCIHEMLEIGTPVIATGWSGNMDFMPRYPHAIAVPFELVPYSDRTSHFQGNGLRWAEADIEEAACALRKVREEWQGARAKAAAADLKILRFAKGLSMKDRVAA